MKKTDLKLEDVMGAFRNPKDHDIGALIVSIRRFGFMSPLIVNEADGRLLAGHGRLEALRAMWSDGEPAPENVKALKDGSWRVPAVLVTIEDPREAEAYLVADNRLTELGGWDESELVDVLKELSAYNSEAFTVTGFDDDDLGKMIERLEGTTPPQIEKPEESKSGPKEVECPSCGQLFEVL